jgi:hypothetical protein
MYLDIQDLETLIHENKETIESELGEKRIPRLTHPEGLGMMGLR